MNIKVLEWVEFFDKKGKTYLYCCGIRYDYTIKENTLFIKCKIEKNAKKRPYSYGDINYLQEIANDMNKRFVKEDIEDKEDALRIVKNRWIKSGAKMTYIAEELRDELR